MCAILKWREINGFGFGGGRGNIITHTYMQNNISRNEQHRNIFKLWFLDAAAEDFSGKTTAGIARTECKRGNFFQIFLMDQLRIKQRYFAFFRPRRDLVFSSSHS